MSVIKPFLELYAHLLNFVLVKLYMDEGLKYPPQIDLLRFRKGESFKAMATEVAATTDRPKLAPTNTRVENKRRKTLQEKLEALKKQAAEKAASQTNGDANADAMDESDNESLNEEPEIDVFEAPDSEPNDEGTEGPTENGDKEEQDPTEQGDEDEQDEESKEKPQDDSSMLSKAMANQVTSHSQLLNLFSGKVMFLRREVPQQSLEFVLQSFGAKVIWDAVGCLDENSLEGDPSVTHVIADRPLAPELKKPGKVYVQPQWVYDSINAGRLMPMMVGDGKGYGMGSKLPPHLSPFVRYRSGDYIPQEATLLDPSIQPTVRTGEDLEEALRQRGEKKSSSTTRFKTTRTSLKLSIKVLLSRNTSHQKTRWARAKPIFPERSKERSTRPLLIP